MQRSTEYPQELVDAIQALSQLVLAEEDLATTMQRIAELSVHVIDGAEDCTVSVARDGKIDTVASTGHVGRKIDRLQYETSEGPCLSSVSEHATFQIRDMAADETWPTFSKRASEQTGTSSMLCYVLEVHGGALGSMNLLSSTVDAFDEEDVYTGALFAVQAGVALANALTHAADQEKVDQLQEGLQTRKIIGQATGLLMAHEGLTAEEAFDQLVHVSQNANIKLRDIASRYVGEWEGKTQPRRKAD